MMRKLAGYAFSEQLTNAFATEALEKQDEAKSETRKKDGKSVDFQTKRRFVNSTMIQMSSQKFRQNGH